MEVLYQEQVEEEDDYHQQEEQEADQAFCWSDKLLQRLLASISQSLAEAGPCDYISS